MLNKRIENLPKKKSCLLIHLTIEEKNLMKQNRKKKINKAKEKVR